MEVRRRMTRKDKRKMEQFNAKQRKRLVWIDLKLTGPKEEENIIEIATVVTEGDLNVVAEGPEIIINQPEYVLGSAHECHPELVEASRKSRTSVKEAEQKTLGFLRKHVIDHRSLIAGDNLNQVKCVLKRCMPKLIAFLHWKIVELDTFRELCRRWHPDASLASNSEANANRYSCLDEIQKSIVELRYYKETIFK